MTDHDDKRSRRGGAGEPDDAFAARIARPLRGDEPVDATFEARVMSAVHAEARARAAHDIPRRGWWRGGRTITITPLATLAMAAGIAAVVFVGDVAARIATRPAPQTVAARPRVAPETVHVVRFVLNDPDARAVSLVGDFNGWSATATPLVQEAGAGRWVVSVQLPSGRHEYAFMVDRGGAHRKEWVADPYAASVRDDFDTISSVVMVGGTSSTHPGSSS